MKNKPILTKLDSHILLDSLIRTMKDYINYSRYENIEFGFNLCSGSQKLLHDENQCLGNECSIDIPKGCKKGEHVGVFHTHTGAISKPSIRDILNAYKLGINCIGSTEENDIKCYVRKDKIAKREELYNIRATMTIYESPLLSANIPKEKFIENYKRWANVSKELTEYYFNTITID
jgi:hypothetical protein